MRRDVALVDVLEVPDHRRVGRAVERADVRRSRSSTTPALSLSRTHSQAYLKSSQVSGWPSDHLRPSRSVHVTVIASPPSPGTLTPPLSRVGIDGGQVRGVAIVVREDDERRPGRRRDVRLGLLADVERVELVGFLPVADDDRAAVRRRPRARRPSSKRSRPAPTRGSAARCRRSRAASTGRGRRTLVTPMRSRSRRRSRRAWRRTRRPSSR